MRSVLNILIAVTAASLLASCDPSYAYDYRLTNGTDSTIHVYYRMLSPHKDTQVDIAPGKEQIIYASYVFNQTSKSQYRSGTNDFDSFVVVKNGVRSSLSYLADSTWRFTVSKNTGIYFYTTYNADF